MKRIMSCMFVVIAALALFGCGQKEEMLIAAQSQERLTDKVLKYKTDTELERIRKTAEIRVAHEATLKAKYEADKYRYGAFIKVAEKADAGGRVAIARSLEDRQEAQFAATAATIPESASIQIPTLQLPKSGWTEFRESMRDIGIPILGLVTNGFIASKQINGQVRMTESNNAAATAQHAATMGAFANASDNQTTLGVAGVTGVRDTALGTVQSIESIIAELTKNPSVQVTGGEVSIAQGGSTVTVVKCPQNVSAAGGNGASGGDGASGGNGGSTGGGGAGGPGAAGGAGGQSNPTSTLNCSTNK